MTEQTIQQPKHPGILRRYIFSLDHKVIGIQYFILALSAALIGTGLSILMRVRLAWPEMRWGVVEALLPRAFPGGVMQPEFYLALMTMHGTIMVFFVLTTAPQGAFGNYFLPIQIGARDMAFPVLNMLSFWTTVLSFLVLLTAFFVEGGAPIAGWTVLPSAECDSVGRARNGDRSRSVVDQHRDLLRGVAVRRVEFHHHRSHFAGSWNDPGPNAADDLVVVYHSGDCAARISSIAGRGHSAPR